MSHIKKVRSSSNMEKYLYYSIRLRKQVAEKMPCINPLIKNIFITRNTVI